MSPIPLGILAVSGAFQGGSYFFGKFDAGSGYQGIGYSVTSDSSGNIYWSCNENGVAYLHKLDISGNLLQQRTFAGSQAYPRRLNMDSSGNLYFAARTTSGQSHFKVNSNLDVIWKKYVGQPENDITAQVLTDGNIASAYSSNTTMYTMMLSSTGALNTIKSYTADSYYSSGRLGGLVAGPSGTSHHMATSWVSGTTPYPHVWKWNSAAYGGTLAWARKLTASGGGPTTPMGLASDASGNVYMASKNVHEGLGVGTSNVAYLSKFNTNGDFQWSVGVSLGVDARAVSVDTNGDVYLLVQWVPTASSYSWGILKFNSAGTLQWQRTIQWGGATEQAPHDIHVNESSFIVTGKTSGTSTGKSAIARLPKDGTKTGTYTVGGVSVTYAASSMTVGGGSGWGYSSGSTGSSWTTLYDDTQAYSATSTAISKVVI